MKIAKLPKNKELRFPDNTPDDVVKKVVKRVLGVIEEPTIPSIQETMDMLSSTLSEREKVDFYSPAVKLQNKTIETTAQEQINTTKNATKDVVSAISKIKFEHKDLTPSFEKQNTLFSNFINLFFKTRTKEQEQNAKHIHELTKQIANVGNKIEMLTISIKEHTISVVKSQDQNTEAVQKLVKAYSSPRKIVRDKEGKPQRIEIN